MLIRCPEKRGYFCYFSVERKTDYLSSACVGLVSCRHKTLSEAMPDWNFCDAEELLLYSKQGSKYFTYYFCVICNR